MPHPVYAIVFHISLRVPSYYVGWLNQGIGNRKTQRTAKNACLNAPFLYIFKQMTSKKCLFTFYQIHQNIVIKILLVWQTPQGSFFCLHSNHHYGSFIRINNPEAKYILISICLNEAFSLSLHFFWWIKLKKNFFLF